jgi:hypothetical protein
MFVTYTLILRYKSRIHITEYIRWEHIMIMEKHNINLIVEIMLVSVNAESTENLICNLMSC